MTSESEGKVVLFAGLGDTGALDHTWVWNGGNWSREDPANSPPERFRASMAYDAAAGKVVLFGGVPPDSGASLLSDTWVWK